MTERLNHGVDLGLDLEVAIALGIPVTAACGKSFVPKYHGAEASQFRDCVTCFPPTKRGKHRTSVHVRSQFPHYVYRCYDAQDRLLYVGCTYNPPARMRQHKAEGKKWIARVTRTRLTVWPDRRKALDMERLAIESETPLFNKQFNREAS